MTAPTELDEHALEAARLLPIGSERHEVIRAYLSALPASEAGWRDMGSAPRDGTRILVSRKRCKSGSMSKNPAIASWVRKPGLSFWQLEIKTNTYPVSSDQLSGWQPLPAPATADGWRMVTIEPTPEMLAAFWRQKNVGTQTIGPIDGEALDQSDYAAYRAMIAAAPTGEQP